MTDVAVIDFIRESNAIEGIFRDPTRAEIEEFNRFIHLPAVEVSDLETFVSVYQPNAKLRRAGQPDVRVGNHTAPPSGHEIEGQLIQILEDAGKDTAWTTHLYYELLHPFTDCNGRSGRMLWAWCMGCENAVRLGFLHAFYYQTLSCARR